MEKWSAFHASRGHLTPERSLQQLTQWASSAISRSSDEQAQVLRSGVPVESLLAAGPTSAASLSLLLHRLRCLLYHRSSFASPILSNLAFHNNSTADSTAIIFAGSSTSPTAAASPFELLLRSLLCLVQQTMAEHPQAALAVTGQLCQMLEAAPVAVRCAAEEEVLDRLLALHLDLIDTAAASQLLAPQLASLHAALRGLALCSGLPGPFACCAHRPIRHHDYSPVG